MEELMTFLDDPELWKGVAFIGAAVLTVMPIYRFILKKMQERSDRITAHLDEALKLRREALDMLRDAKHKEFYQEKDKKEIVQKALKEARILKNEAEKDLQKRQDLKQAEILERIRLIRESGLHELKEQVISIAVQTAMDVIQKDEKLAENKVFFDKALEEVTQVLTQKEEQEKILRYSNGNNFS